jgi:hypothetical protein
VGRDNSGYAGDLAPAKTGIFFLTGLDSPNQLEPIEENSFWGHTRLRRKGRHAVRTTASWMAIS